MNVPGTGRKVYITLWSLLGQSWQANSYVYDTTYQNAVPPTTLKAAKLLVPTAAIPGSTYTFQWTPGVGATMYWLSVGSTVDGSDYYDERNIGTQTLSSTVRTLPANASQVYVTLYSRINNAWVPDRSSLQIVVRLVGVIDETFRLCISTGGCGSVCTLPEGTYYMWNTQTTKHISITTTLQLNAPIVIGRSGITVRGSGPTMPKIVRYNPEYFHNPNWESTPGCQRLMEVSVGVSNVIIEGFEFEGSAGAYAGFCRPAPVNGQEIAQPKADDLFLLGQNTNVTIRNSEFRNAVGSALTIYNSNQNTITVTGNRFVEPNLVGILIGNNGVWDGSVGPNAPQHYTPQHTYCDLISSGLPAAATADVPRNLLISSNTFLRSWTGAVALNRSRLVTVLGNQFIDNYQRPYDFSCGTMNTTECDYDTRIEGNVFSGDGLILASGYSTQALELHGLKETVHDNVIRGYPNNAILARSTKDLVITSNTIERNGRALDNDQSGIDIWNQVSNRVTSNVLIQGNTITNASTSPGLPGNLPFAARFSQHACEGSGAPPVADCTLPSLSVINNVQVTSNQFVGMTNAPYCVMPNVMAATGWNLQVGMFQCQ